MGLDKRASGVPRPGRGMSANWIRTLVSGALVLASVGAGAACGPSEQESKREVALALEIWIQAMDTRDWDVAYSQLSAASMVLFPKEQFIGARQEGRDPRATQFVLQTSHELKSVELEGTRAVATVTFTMPNPRVLLGPVVGETPDSIGQVSVDQDFELVLEPEGWKLVYSGAEIGMEELQGAP